VNFSSSAVGLAFAPALERPGAAADIANLVAFLVSEDGRWVNGQVIRANGVIGSQTQGPDQGFHECEARREALR
jgi:NAD(P)-dependent dehydrogenase (short-subunit alcohol dehydrogenase family)